MEVFITGYHGMYKAQVSFAGLNGYSLDVQIGP